MYVIYNCVYTYSRVHISSDEVFSKILKKPSTDYGRPMRKSPSLHGQKSTPTPKFFGTAESYFVCHIGPNFQSW